jgi:hypothetical protein
MQQKLRHLIEEEEEGYTYQDEVIRKLGLPERAFYCYIYLHISMAIFILLLIYV